MRPQPCKAFAAQAHSTALAGPPPVLQDLASRPDGSAMAWMIVMEAKMREVRNRIEASEFSENTIFGSEHAWTAKNFHS